MEQEKKVNTLIITFVEYRPDIDSPFELIEQHCNVTEIKPYKVNEEEDGIALSHEEVFKIGAPDVYIINELPFLLYFHTILKYPFLVNNAQIFVLLEKDHSIEYIVNQLNGIKDEEIFENVLQFRGFYTNTLLNVGKNEQKMEEVNENEKKSVTGTTEITDADIVSLLANFN